MNLSISVWTILILAHLSDLTVLRWKNIGPNRGGRSQAVAGSQQRPLEYYFGAAGGGLWKTTDAGLSWNAVTDGQIGSSSIGAVAMAPSDPNIVYLGTGETELRASVLQGDGMYKSLDSGKTWHHIGLEDTQAISRIRVNPQDPDIVFVAALGHPFGRNRQRGVFRSKDGGISWKQVLFRGDLAGAIDLCFDPRNSNVLYASVWDASRTPWLLSSGGTQSGLFKSIDGGDTWTDISRHEGLPKGILGKIGVTVSGADSRRVYAVIEAEDGGLFRSEDAGETWAKVNEERKIRQRAFYFSRIYADPRDRDTVYVLNVDAFKSTDGGVTLSPMNSVHLDHHDLWIAPDDPSRLAEANDGGGTVSVNGGKTWTSENFPTAQFYHVATTRDIPYQVCGSQQDYDTVCLSSSIKIGPRITDEVKQEQTYTVGAGEAAYVAASPRDKNIFYSGDQAGVISRFDRLTGEIRDVSVYPLFFSGMPARSLRDRWQWVFPIVVSRVDPKIIYTASQRLWKSTNEGHSWESISPDLTRANPKTLGDSGGPITKDQNGPEIYGTIFSIGLSHEDENTTWAGSDDGLVSITHDAGKSWQNITPTELPEFSRITSIETSAHHPGTAYLSARRYELDDLRPYIFRTNDYGKTWKKIVDGVGAADFINVIREDTVKPGLLYAGSSHRVYLSFDDGEHWESLSPGLPDVSVVDMVIEGADLVISTHGRSFWILEGIGLLREEPLSHPGPYLFTPTEAFRQIKPAVIDFILPADHANAKLSILDSHDAIVRTFVCPTSAVEKQPDTMSCEIGTNRVVWDLTYAGPTIFQGIILRSAEPSAGPLAPPGNYQVRLEVNGSTEVRRLSVRHDPRDPTIRDDDLQKQFELAMRIRDSTSVANQTVIRIRELKAQIRSRRPAITSASILANAKELESDLSGVEESLYQVRNRSPRDPLNFPIKLNNQLAFLQRLVDTGDYPPTAQHYSVYDELRIKLESAMSTYEVIVKTKLKALNHDLSTHGFAPIN